jgi:hypothetical protein
VFIEALLRIRNKIKSVDSGTMSVEAVTDPGVSGSFMYIRNDSSLPSDEEMQDLINQAAAQEEERWARKKGSTRLQLVGREKAALFMLERNLPLRRQVDLWLEVGVVTTAVSLRSYFKSSYPKEWAEYLARTGRGRKENRSRPD